MKINFKFKLFLDGDMNIESFRKIYPLMRHENPEKMSGIMDHVFKAFDQDGNGLYYFSKIIINFFLKWNQYLNRYNKF